MTYQDRYIYATITVAYEESNVIKQMIETGEYGFGQHDITTEAILDFIGRKEFGSYVMCEDKNTTSTDSDFVEYRISDDEQDFLVKVFQGERKLTWQDVLGNLGE